MIDVVLYQPEIPPNTGNVIRLCANTGARLHLVKPFGFRLSERAVKRAGLDYDELASVTTHTDWDACRAAFTGRRLFAVTTRGTAIYSDVAFMRDDVLVFGPETRGLPEAVLSTFPEHHRMRLPMRAGNRSLNLSNAAAVVVYEAWRQLRFSGSA